MANPTYVTRRAAGPVKPPCDIPEKGSSGPKCSRFEDCGKLYMACTQYLKYCGELDGNPKQTRKPSRKLYNKMNRTRV